MTRDEQKAITAFIDNAVRCDQPLDVEADAIIRALFVRQPDAAYRITLLAMQLARAACVEAPSASALAPAASRGWLGGIFEKAPKSPQREREPRREQRTPQSVFTER